MKVLFGKYNIQVKNTENKKFIYDIIRKKWIVLTPEEQVRQIWLHYLTQDKNISSAKIAVEKGLMINDKLKRFDICIYNQHLQPYLLIECKTPERKLSLPDLEQLTQYNLRLGVEIFILTNGLQHIGFTLDNQKTNNLEVF